jgi:hypothetical protein
VATVTGTAGLSNTSLSLYVDNTPGDQSVTQSLLNAAFASLQTAPSVVANTASVLGGTFTLPPVTSPGTVGVASITGSVSGSLFLGTGYQVLTNIDSAPITVVGNGGTNVFIGSGSQGGLTFNANGGTGTVAAGGGSNLVGSPSTVSSSYSYNLDGTKNTVVAFSGNNTVNFGGSSGGDLTGATNGNDLINIGGANDTVVIGTGSMTVNVSVGGSALIGAVDANGKPTTGNLTFINQSALGSTIFGGAGSDTINGGPGAGGVFVGGTGGNNVITSGTGNTTIFAGGNNDLISVVGSGSDFINGASGNETLSAATATGNDTFNAASGNLSIFASTVSGTADTFDFVNGQTKGATDTIFNFTSSDVVSLSGYAGSNPPGYTSSPIAGGTMITLSDGTKINIYGATPTIKST